MKTNYDLIAAEYFDARHKTCRNFDQTTIAQNIRLCCRAPVVEFCAGIGRCFEFTRQFSQVHVDSSIEMLKLQPREAAIRIHCDARKTPFIDEEFGGAVAFLCDPALDQEFIDEVYRVVQPGGTVLLTTPAYEWGVALRCGEHHETTFVKQNGDKVTVPSNLYTEDQLRKMMGKFSTVQVWSAALPKGFEPSNAVLQACVNDGRTPTELPLVTFIRAVK